MASFGIAARNHEQKAAIQTLYNDKPFLFLTGKAGTGKTLITQAVGLERTIENHDYSKLVYTRLQIQLGEHLGYLTGDVNEKTYPFIAPFMDNLEVISDRAKDIAEYFALDNGKNNRKSKIFFDPIQTLRGRSMLNAFVMIDESQNLDIHTIAAIATRPAFGTKIIFLGNFAQIDNPKLRIPEANGMYRLLEGMYREDPNFEFFDHVNLTIEERHPAVGLVEKILRNNDVDPKFEELEQRGNVMGVA
jgi:predicted ribonuclease YlaK